MFKNYIKIAIRSLIRHRFFSAINIFGLAVAMALSMVIIMLVADQMMYDRYNTRRDRIYRINSIPIGSNGETRSETATTTLPLRQELLENYTGVEKAVRIVKGFGNLWLEIEQNVNIPVAGYFADPEVLEVFEYELEHGDPHTALVEPYSVVLTKKPAKKLGRTSQEIQVACHSSHLQIYIPILKLRFQVPIVPSFYQFRHHQYILYWMLILYIIASQNPLYMIWPCGTYMNCCFKLISLVKGKFRKK